MAEQDSEAPASSKSGKERISESSPPATIDHDATSASLASRIGASAGGLLGDLLAPTSTTQSLASAAAQGKGSGGQSSTDGASFAAHAGSVNRAGQVQGQTSTSLGSFRQQRNFSTVGDDETAANDPPVLDVTDVRQPELAEGSLAHTQGFESGPVPPSLISRQQDESFEDYNRRLLLLEGDVNPSGPSIPGLSAKADAEAEAATWIAQFNDASASERSYYRDVMKHARAGSAASERGWHEPDGADVLRLLDAGPLNLDSDNDTTAVTAVTAATATTSTIEAPRATGEPEVSADDLFGGGESFSPIARDNHVNLRPDYAALDPRVDPVSGATISQEQNMRDVLDRMAQLDQWNDVLDSYSDHVWAPEQMAKAVEARKQLEEARKEAADREASSQPESPADRPALRRLQDLMAQLDVKGKTTNVS